MNKNGNVINESNIVCIVDNIKYNDDSEFK